MHLEHGQVNGPSDFYTALWRLPVGLRHLDGKHHDSGRFDSANHHLQAVATTQRMIDSRVTGLGLIGLLEGS